MEMHQVRYFLKACETLNFTRAAEQCGVSVPSLSRAIRDLEEELGGQLFRRERHLTHLTDLGRLMQQHLTTMSEAAEAARRDAEDYARLSGSRLTVRYVGEREDWVQATVRAGLGCTVMPEHLPLLEGIEMRRLIDPEVFRQISLATVAGRPHGAPVAAAVRAARRYQWPNGTLVAAGAA